MELKLRHFFRLLPLLIIGCSKESEQRGAVEAPPPAVATESPGAAASDAHQIATTLAELTQAVRKYGAEKQKAPKDLNELVAAGYLASIPPAPAGKKYAIDQRMQVYLADQ